MQGTHPNLHHQLGRGSCQGESVRVRCDGLQSEYELTKTSALQGVRKVPKLKSLVKDKLKPVPKKVPAVVTVASSTDLDNLPVSMHTVGAFHQPTQN